MSIYILWPDWWTTEYCRVHHRLHVSKKKFKILKPVWRLHAATTSCDSAPLWRRRGRPLRLAAGAWTRRVIWGRRRSRWRDGSAERSPARCRLQPARTSAGPDSSSRDQQKPGFWRERRGLWGRVILRCVVLPEGAKSAVLQSAWWGLRF